MRKIIIAVTAGLLLGGCASSYKLAEPMAALGRSGLINDPKQVSRLEKAMTDGDIAKLLDLDVRAKLPTSLAVAKLRDAYSPRLAQIDAEELDSWEKIVAGQAFIAGVQPISNLTFGNYLGRPRITLRSLRQAAAKLHCELLLVYLQGDSRVDNFNDAAALYWSFVGLWVVPGNVLEHKTVMHAIVVDCRTGVILGTATGDSHLKKLSPAMFTSIHEQKMAARAPINALADLQKGSKALLSSIVARAAARR